MATAHTLGLLPFRATWGRHGSGPSVAWGSVALPASSLSVRLLLAGGWPVPPSLHGRGWPGAAHSHFCGELHMHACMACGDEQAFVWGSAGAARVGQCSVGGVAFSEVAARFAPWASFEHFLEAVAGVFPQLLWLGSAGSLPKAALKQRGAISPAGVSVLTSEMWCAFQQQAWHSGRARKPRWRGGRYFLGAGAGQAINN